MREADLAGVTAIALPATRARSESPFIEGVRRLRKSTTAVIGFVIVVGAPRGRALRRRPRAVQPDRRPTRCRPSSVRAGTTRSAPTSSAATCSRAIIHGTRISLLVGVSSVLLALFVGVPFGMIAGFYGGRSTAASCASWT